MKRLLLATAVLALVALALNKRQQQRAEWRGISEAEAREKLDRRLPSRIPDERREMITDRIVTGMRNRGVIADDLDDDDIDVAVAVTDADTEIDLREQPAEAATTN